MVNNMSNDNKQKISELSNIFSELITDAKDFAKDMISGIYFHYFAGVLSVLFGFQTGWYNRNYITNGDLIPLILMVAQILVGIIIVGRGISLRKKYSRIFDFKNRL